MDYLKHLTELILSSVIREGNSITTHELHCKTVFLTLQTPHATVHSSEVADAWFAWHSMPVKTKIKHRYTGVEEVHAIPTGRFLCNSKGRVMGKSSLFCCIYYILKCQELWFSMYCFPQSIRSKYTSSCIPPSSTFFSIPEFQRARVHSSSTGNVTAFPILRIFLNFSLVFQEMSFDD